MEIEAKFAVPTADALARFKQLDQLAGYALSAEVTEQVRDCYLDTPTRAILAAGYALRWRRGKADTVISLKGLGGAEGAVHRREELQVRLPLHNPGPAWLAGPVYARLFDITGPATLQLLFCLNQTRTKRQLYRDGAQVAELSLDEVCLTINGQVHAYCELEVERAAAGTEADLATLAACLQTEHNLQPEPLSKFERALALLNASASGALLAPAEEAVIARIAATEKATYNRRAKALLALNRGAATRQAGQQAGLSVGRVRYWRRRLLQDRLNIFPAAVLARAQPGEPAVGTDRVTVLPDPPTLSLDDTMADAARHILRFHFERMLFYEAGTRLGEDIEALHDMRVATRRMRAALRVFGDYLDAKQVRPFRKGLRRTGRALGLVRDLDVFWEKTQQFLNDHPVEPQPDLRPLEEAWAAQHAAHRTTMLAYLDGPRYSKFKTKFTTFLRRPGAGARPVLAKNGTPRPHRLRHTMPVILRRHWAAVQAYDEWIAGPDASAACLHRLRIECKQFRYALEFFQSALGPEAKDMIRHIKVIQNHLGALQDAVVAVELVRNFLRRGTFEQTKPKGDASPPPPPDAPGVEAYLAARLAEQQRLQNTFPETWQAFKAIGFNTLLAAVLAPL
ncbi:MAG: CHAD domain-containing protein [Anaerolineae bacterium]